VHAAVDDFYKRVLGDPSLAPFFSGVDMGTAHAGLGISDANFDSVVSHLVTPLTSLSVSDDIIGQIGAALSPLRSGIATAPVPEPAG
jgi:hemoglobin